MANGWCRGSSRRGCWALRQMRRGACVTTANSPAFCPSLARNSGKSIELANNRRSAMRVTRAATAAGIQGALAATPRSPRRRLRRDNVRLVRSGEGDVRRYKNTRHRRKDVRRGDGAWQSILAIRRRRPACWPSFGSGARSISCGSDRWSAPNIRFLWLMRCSRSSGPE
jgi:hypothetical protein